MIPRNQIVLILSGIITGVILAFLVMAIIPLYPAEFGTTTIPVQQVTRQATASGAVEINQFSSENEAFAFVQSHTDGFNEARILTEWPDTADIPVWDTTNGTRTWRYDIDTSTFRPDEYIVTVEAIVQDATGTALFNVLERPTSGGIMPTGQRTVSSQGSGEFFITVNPIGDRYIGERFTISGLTNLPADAEMLVQVYSSSFKPTQKSQSGEFSGATGTIRASSSAQQVAAPATAQSGETEREYSATNVQVEEVDEADIIKTDGTFIYVVTGKRLHILQAYPADSAAIISTLQFSGDPLSLYLHGDSLVLITSEYFPRSFMNCRSGMCGSALPGVQKTRVFVYSVKDPAHPELLRELELDGMHKETRMIGSVLYFITTNYVDPYAGDMSFPAVYDSREGTTVPRVYYFERNEREFALTTVGAVDIASVDAVRAKTFLIGAAGTVYVSPENLYIAMAAPYNYGGPEETDLYAFALDNGRISYTAHATIDGTLLNQFSMDEYDGNLRVATTVEDWNGRSGTRYSRVTVLDHRMNEIGAVGDLAPGERIYAARFMGERLYLVTFRETDPLFVIDLSDPSRPNVLGELHIPGFSSYLHPYDTTHLIGVGKQSSSGGLKLALFDVSDVHHPLLMDEVKLGGYGSDSEVLRDHKAFLFDREMDLLVLPVHIREDATQANNWNPPQWGGAYVFGVTPEDGFRMKGTVVHYQDTQGTGKDVKRALYIENTLYTMSPDKIVMTSLGKAIRPAGSVRLA